MRTTTTAAAAAATTAAATTTTKSRLRLGPVVIVVVVVVGSTFLCCCLLLFLLLAPCLDHTCIYNHHLVTDTSHHHHDSSKQEYFFSSKMKSLMDGVIKHTLWKIDNLWLYPTIITSANHSQHDQQHDPHHHEMLLDQNNKNKDNPTSVNNILNEFPTLNETLDMAALSLLVYQFETEPNDTAVCESINKKHEQPMKYSTLLLYPKDFTLPSDLQCHWYYHDRLYLGIQLMIVSSQSPRPYLAVVFAGTDNYQTTLLDANIWKKPFGDTKHHKWTLPPQQQASKKRIKVHAGFDNAVFQHDVFDQILSRIQTIQQQHTKQQQLASIDPKQQLSSPPTITPLKLYTTGHSLGAAAALLTAVGLANYYNESSSSTSNNNNIGNHHNTTLRNDLSRTINTTTPTVITCLNFGCPCVGNRNWRNYLHSAGSDTVKNNKNNLNLWRFVLGWDLVPRLPDFFYHVGHTVQLSGKCKTTTIKTTRRKQEDPNQNNLQNSNNKNNKNHNHNNNNMDDSTDDFYDHVETKYVKYHNQSNNKKNNNNNNPLDRHHSNCELFHGKAMAYYHHYGNKMLNYASVPYGWNERPYLWIPGALESHNINLYWQFLYDFSKQQQQDDDDNNDNDDASISPPKWISDFVPWTHKNKNKKNESNNNNNNTDDDYDPPPNVDDNDNDDSVKSTK